MAERVLYHLESGLTALHYLQEKEILSQDEVNAVVKRRREFEYKLQRRQQKLLDFLRYMEYEINLEELLMSRRKQRQAADGQTTKAQTKPTLPERFHWKHMHRLFREATRKFPQEKSLWMEWIRYCRRCRSHVVLNRVLPQALQFHPRSPVFWLEACSWEWEETGNVTACRSFFHRALQFIPDSVGIWCEYHRMELLFLIKILERRDLLSGPISDKESADINLDAYPSVAPTGGPVPPSNVDDKSLEFMRGAVPKRIAKEALKQCLASKRKQVARLLFDQYREYATKFPSVQSACLEAVEALRNHLDNGLE